MLGRVCMDCGTIFGCKTEKMTKRCDRCEIGCDYDFADYTHGLCDVCFEIKTKRAKEVGR